MNEAENNISISEKVTRYFFDESGYSANSRRVRYNALLPNRNGKTSVFWISNLTPVQIWDIGQWVAEIREKILRARGDIIGSHVLSEGLIIESETTVHSLHANIIGWPEQRSEKLLIAKKLARKTELQLKPLQED